MGWGDRLEWGGDSELPGRRKLTNGVVKVERRGRPEAGSQRAHCVDLARVASLGEVNTRLRRARNDSNYKGRLTT